LIRRFYATIQWGSIKSIVDSLSASWRKQLILFTFVKWPNGANREN